MSVNHLCQILFLIQLQTASLQFYYKETPAQVFSYEFSKISGNIDFEEYLQTAASKILTVDLTLH